MMWSDKAIKRNKNHVAAKSGSRATLQWLAFAIAGSISLMLCLTINFRAFSEMTQEANLNESLNSQIQNLTTENLALQEEIHNIKSDSHAIEREARKIGMSRPNEKVLVPAN